MPIIILMSIDYTYVHSYMHKLSNFNVLPLFIGNDDRNMKLAFAFSLKFGKTLSRELQVLMMYPYYSAFAFTVRSLFL